LDLIAGGGEHMPHLLYMEWLGQDVVSAKIQYLSPKAIVSQPGGDDYGR
jgi:hypothetical protein